MGGGGRGRRGVRRRGRGKEEGVVVGSRGEGGKKEDGREGERERKEGKHQKEEEKGEGGSEEGMIMERQRGRRESGRRGWTLRGREGLGGPKE